MSETSTPVLPGTSLPAQRPCTRCDGSQHLVAEDQGMGKYRCDTCEMVVGFDLHAEPVEFLLSRGLPRRYSKQVFGERLQPGERRLSPEPVEEHEQA
jgi:hypothetical protein